MDRLTAADAWFLYLESPTVHLHVTGLLLLDPSTAPDGFSFARFRTYLAGRLDQMPALCRRLVEVPFGIDHPCWAVDPDFDLDRHLAHVDLGGHGSPRDLADRVGVIASTPLLRDRPLWQMVLVEGLEDGSAALVAKMHHCIVDGITGLDIMAHLLEMAPSGPRSSPACLPAAEPVPGPVGAAVSAAWNRVGTPLRPARAAAGVASSLTHMGGGAIRRRVGGAHASAHPLNAPRTMFNATLTANREVAFGNTSLDDLRAIRTAFGVTINDVVLGMCAPGLRHYLGTFDRTPDRPLVCSVPISTHGRGGTDGNQSANQVSTMFVDLPVHVADPAEQLRLVHEGCLAAKEMQSAVGTHMIGDVVELVPPALLRGASRLYSKAGLADRLPPVHNLIVSNVIGSPVPLYLAGAAVVGMYPFGPLMEGAGLNISVLSNNGELDVGLIACTELVPRADALVTEVLRSVDTLLSYTHQPRRSDR